SLDSLYLMLRGATIEGIREAYERGGVVLVEGLETNLFVCLVLSDEGEIIEGLKLVLNAFIEAQSTGAYDSLYVQIVLNDIAEAVAINVSSGSALALGPDGAVEVWGEDQNVTISLGRKYLE